jgi:hypothetical protein
MPAAVRSAAVPKGRMPGAPAVDADSVDESSFARF